jgi:hypothetical protein
MAGCGPTLHGPAEDVQYEAQIDHVRHSRFMGLRENHEPREVAREAQGGMSGVGEQKAKYDILLA